MAPSVLNEGWMCTSYLSHVDLIQDIKLLTVLPDLTTTCKEEKVPLPFLPLKRRRIGSLLHQCHYSFFTLS